MGVCRKTDMRCFCAFYVGARLPSRIVWWKWILCVRYTRFNSWQGPRRTARNIKMICSDQFLCFTARPPHWWLLTPPAPGVDYIMQCQARPLLALQRCFCSDLLSPSCFKMCEVHTTSRLGLAITMQPLTTMPWSSWSSSVDAKVKPSLVGLLPSPSGS